MAESPHTSSVDPGRRKLNLSLLWFGQLISHVGDSLAQLAGMFLVLKLEHGSGEAVKSGLTGMMRALPALIFGVHAGVLVDRHDRRRLMIVADLARAAILSAIPLCFVFGVLQWWMVAGTVFLAACFSTLFDPARDALLPRLAAGASLVRVNAAFQSTLQAGMIIGAMLVGFGGLADGSSPSASPIEGLIWIFGLNALSYLVSAILLSCIKESPLPVSMTPPPKAGRTSTRADISEVMKLVWSDGRLRGLLFITAVNNFFIMGPAYVGASILIARDMNLPVEYLGLYNLGLGVGWFIGTLFMMRFGRRIRKGRMILAGMFFDGITHVPIFFLQDAPFSYYVVAMAAHGFFIPWITVARTSLVQSYYPSEIQGRIFALIGITVIGFTSLSAAVTGALGEAMTGWDLFLLSGVFGGACGIIGLLFEKLRRTA
ncbi:MAG: MFS transporter [Planctomycetaceae bacterium]|nr:MFS transporter [Planctomycetaceae bacterium]